MKNLQVFFFLFCMGTSTLLFAQDHPKNVVKLGLGTIWLGNIKPSYERVLHDKLSANLMVGWLVPRSLPGLITDAPDNEDPFDFQIDRSTLKGIAIVPEFRYYVSGNAPKGFYLAPFARYAKYSISGIDELEEEGYPNGEGIATGTWKAVGGGLQLGVQWVTGSGITIDFAFLGIGINKYSISGRYTTDNLDENFLDTLLDIKTELDNPDEPYSSQTNENYTLTSMEHSSATSADGFVEGELKFTYPAFRGVFSIGYNF